MNHPTRTLIALAAVAILSACGGGESTNDALSSQPDQRRQALAAAPTITNAQIFQWAQLQYPELFGTGAPTVMSNFAFEGKVFDVRDFHNGNYLGISGGRAYGYGNFTGFGLVDFGAIQDYAGQVCSRVDCGGGTGPVGSLNGCTEPASTALRVGNRATVVYVNSTLVAPLSSGEYQVDTEVQGNAAFEGQSTIKARSKITGWQEGANVDSEVFSFLQVAEGELTRTIGSEVSMSFGGVAATTHAVWTPPSLNTEFTLAKGSSLTKTETITSSMVVPGMPVQLPPTTATTKTTHVFMDTETVTVLGRSFETCRYQSTTEGTAGSTVTWYIMGRGIPARIESRDATGRVDYRAELKSAVINGSRL